MKKTEVINENSSRKNRATQLVLVCLFLVFTFFIFGPLETYLSNTTELWFSLTDILPGVLLCALIAFILFFGIGILLKGKAQNIYIALLFGLGLGLYVQGNFMTIKYGVLDGRTINWNEYTGWGIINLIIWVVCLVTPFLVSVFFNTKFSKLIKTLSFIFISIQVVTLSLLLISSNLNKESKIILTEKEQFTVSANKNITVFILDTFDSEYCNQLLENYPEYKEIFNDFTYYSNVLGATATTNAAVPQILTGNVYDNSLPYKDYVKTSWQNNPLLEVAKKNNFNIRIYTDSRYVSTVAVSDIKNAEIGSMIPSNRLELTKLHYKLVTFKYMPHFLKPSFLIYSGEFDKYKSMQGINSNVYILDDARFFTRLQNEEIKIDSKSNTINFYHLFGAHPPYTLNENAERNPEGTSTLMQQIRGSLRLVVEYINLLKKNNLYDNTAIIVMADHGKLNLWQNPAILFKDFNSDSTFSVSEAPISYAEDLMPTLLSLMTGDYESYKNSILNIPENYTRERRYMFYRLDSAIDVNYMPPISEYITTGHAADLNETHFTGRRFTKDGIISLGAYKYNMGDVISLKSDREFYEKAVIFGLSEFESDWIWSSGSKTKMVMQIKKKENKNIKLDLRLAFVYNNNQRVRLFANDQFIEEQTITTERDVSFIIPKELITGDTLTLEFEYPDAQLGENPSDPRIFAIAFQTMELNYTDYARLNGYPLIDKHCSIDFTSAEVNSQLKLKGWYGIEPSGRWTCKESEIVFSTNNFSEMTVRLFYSKLNDNGETTVRFNGHDIAVLAPGNNKTAEIVFSKELFDQSGVQTISFITPDAYSPASKGLSEDKRELGVYMKSIEFDFQ